MLGVVEPVWVKSMPVCCNQTFCVEINWTESIISSKDLAKWLGMFCLGCRIPKRRWFPRLHEHNSYQLRLLHGPVHFIVQTLADIPSFLAANQIIIYCPFRFIPMFLSSNKKIDMNLNWQERIGIIKNTYLFENGGVVGGGGGCVYGVGGGGGGGGGGGETK